MYGLKPVPFTKIQVFGQILRPEIRGPDPLSAVRLIPVACLCPAVVLFCGRWRYFLMPASSMSLIVAAAGGSFLLESRTPAEVFTPEDLNEEQRHCVELERYPL